MSKIYYKGDLDLLLSFLDGDGEAIQWPRGVDWELKLWCDDYSGVAAYVGERDGETYGCTVGADGRIRIKTDNPGLGIGPLKAAMRVSTPDTDYSDERRDVWNRLQFVDAVELVTEPVVPQSVEMNSLAPFFPVDMGTLASRATLTFEFDNGATATIPVSSATTLTDPPAYAYGYYGGAGFMIGEWDEAAMTLGIDDENNSNEERTDGGEDVPE